MSGITGPVQNYRKFGTLPKSKFRREIQEYIFVLTPDEIE